MIPVIVIRKHYKLENDTYLEHGCDYVLKKNKAIRPGGYGVSPYSLRDACEQMLAVKKYYGKTTGNQLIHLVVSYDDLVKTEEQACALTYKLASYYKDNYQMLFCTHEKDRFCPRYHYHMHMMINSVNYRNGKMFISSIENMNRFCEYVTEITGRRSKPYFTKEDKVQEAMNKRYTKNY